MNNVYRDKKSVGPMVSSQKRRAFFRPADKQLANHSSVARCVSRFGTYYFVCSCLRDAGGADGAMQGTPVARRGEKNGGV